jgi:integrase
MIFKRAVIWKYLKENPAQYVSKPRAERKEMGFFTPKEIKIFLENARPRAYALFATAILTGLRLGELLALQWGDISWSTSQIYVRRSLYKGRFIEPKSRYAVRSVALTPKLATILKKHRLSSPPSEFDLVFCTKDGKPLDHSNVINQEFLPTLRRAGLRRIRFHDLRHTFASLLLHQGENIKYVQRQLGHASVQTTLDLYGHLLPDIHNRAGERLDETVFGNTSRIGITGSHERAYNSNEQ